MLDVGLSILDDDLVLVALRLQTFNLFLAFDFLFHRRLNLLHTDVGVLLGNAQQLLLIVSLSGKFVNGLLCFFKLLETCDQVFCLPSALLNDLHKDLLVARYEVEIVLRSDCLLRPSHIVEVNGSIDHILSVLA